jgi:hypothetical protein
MDTLHLSIPFFTHGTLSELIAWLLGIFVAIQTIARAIPTPKDAEIKNPILKILNLLLNKTNIQNESKDAASNDAIKRAFLLAAQQNPSLIGTLEQALNTLETPTSPSTVEIEKKAMELLEQRLTPEKIQLMMKAK